MTLRCHISLSSSWLRQFFRPSIFLWLWQFWEVLFGHLIECPSVEICLIFSSWIDCFVLFCFVTFCLFWQEENQQGQCHFHRSRSRAHTIMLYHCLFDVDLDDLTELVLSSCSMWICSSPYSIHDMFLGEKPLMSAPTEERSCTLSWGVEYNTYIS